MSIRYATKAGNWSDVTVWDGGASLPSSGDDVYANNFVVNINQSVTVNSLQKISNASPAITAGGSFVVTTAATVTITAGIQSAHNVTNSTYLLLVQAGSAAVTINANIAGGAGAGIGGRVGLKIDSTYTGTCTVNGNVICGAGVNSYGIQMSGGTLNLVGDLQANNTAGISGLISLLNDGANSVINITGNVTGSGSTLSSSATFTNTGASATITVTGAVTGGVNASTNYGILNSGASAQFTIVGTIAGGTTAAAINTTGGYLRIDAMLKWGASGSAPFLTTVPPQFKRTGANLGMQAPSDDNWPAATGATITVQRYTTGNPAPADVRSGTTYGPGGTSTGTLAVPPAASVASGVPVDATTGTAALKLSDVLSGTGSQIAAVFP